MTIVGAGTMGCGIAASVAAAGHAVVLQDPFEDMRAVAASTARDALHVLVQGEVLSEGVARDAVERISVSESLDSVKSSSFVIECVPEKLELKRALFAKLSRIAPEHVILATNTSSLSIAQVGSEVLHPGRFLATHFYYPAHVMPLVELVRVPETESWAIEKTVNLLEQLGKVVVRCLDTPGYIASRIQMAMIVEAVRLLEEGIAGAEDIDAAVRNSFGPRMAVMGPLETVDSAGLDIYLKASETYYRELGDAKFRPPSLLREKVAKGELGIKAGRGLHTDMSRIDPANRASQLIMVLRCVGALKIPGAVASPEASSGPLFRH